MSDNPIYHARLTTWQRDAARLTPLRTQVFVIEQGVPAEIEIDALDPMCVHAIAEDAVGKVIGTGRLLPAENGCARIGRMAVAAAWRNRGVGAVLLDCLLNAARQRGDRAILLHAQISAERFYLRHGFAREGAVFEEAGIAHVTMRRVL
jgi:predicted GNAT family N-acyltransferase